MLDKKEVREVIEIVKQAAQVALKEQESITIETKPDSTIVTNADIKVSEFLSKKLERFYPVLSEENYNKDLLKNNDTFFVIDPIDGTVSFSKKEPTWCILLGLVKDNLPIFSIIYVPLEDKLYYAEKNKGTYLLQNNSITKISLKNNKKRIITSPDYKEEALKLAPKYEEHLFEYGCALKAIRILENKADFYPAKDRWYGIWDLIAPVLIFQEAGGEFKFFDDFKFNLNQEKINVSFLLSAYKK